MCSANAWRSPIAEALLKKLRPDIEVDSAGTYAYRKVIEEVRDFLAREDADHYVKKVPEDLDSKQLNEYGLIIVMEPKHKNVVLSKCPECRSKVILWNIADPIKLPPGYGEKIFRQLKQKVKELAESLKVDEMWKVELKDNREVTLRFLTVDDKNGLYRMFSSMSDEALRWSMAPCTIERIQRWINNIQNLISLVAEYKGKWMWLWNTIDRDTRYILTSMITEKRKLNDARRVFQKAKAVGKSKPKAVVTDWLQAYHRAFNKEFFTLRNPRTKHIRMPRFVDRVNNNLVERLNGTVRERDKVMRGFKTLESAQQIIKGFRAYYNFIRKHQSPNGKTPAEMAMMDIQLGRNKWMNLIQKASNARKPS